MEIANRLSSSIGKFVIMAKKKSKKRAKKYDPKLNIRGSFDDVIGLSAQPMQDPKESKPEGKKSKK